MESVRDIESRFGIKIDIKTDKYSTKNTSKSTSKPQENKDNKYNIQYQTESLNPIDTAYYQYINAINNSKPENLADIYAQIGISSSSRYNDLYNYMKLLYRNEELTWDNMTDFELLSMIPVNLHQTANNILTRQELIKYVQNNQNNNINNNTNSPNNNTNTSNNLDNDIYNQYHDCLVTAADRKSKGTLKLCPEGYCTAKLTYDVYPSYWANLNASKICSGEKEDLEGNIKNYYQQ
jgi:hypothetical protein